MYLAPHVFAQRPVHPLVAGHPAGAGKLRCHDPGGEMHPVTGVDLHLRSGEGGVEQTLQTSGVQYGEPR